jgi:hypothetical protein
MFSGLYPRVTLTPPLQPFPAKNRKEGKDFVRKRLLIS